ncbi:hypothetical protein HZA99_01260 [Candidatus Woesearchaeota archaeon]|nr:hypothetical protein [Candidatus Woesearchaeota archaeon]
MAEARKTRAQQIQEARKAVDKERSRTRNTGAGISFINAKHSSATGRLKK